MELSQAIARCELEVLPGLFSDNASLVSDRLLNEDAISTLMTAWMGAPLGRESFSWELILRLADRNRGLCDTYGIENLQKASSSALSRKLSAADHIAAVAKLQHKSIKKITAVAGPDGQDLAVAWVASPVHARLIGIDIETTDRDPARGYIINLGLEFAEFESELHTHDGFSAYFGLPDMYEEKGVPLSRIHHVTWSDLNGKLPFREDTKAQQALLAAMCAYPYMAHNAAFEDSWFMLHVNGYAEARKAGKICIVDSREICRRLDPEVRSLPRESSPASLEAWARRRGTLLPQEKERHLGLDDVDLMLRTAYAEFKERNIIPSDTSKSDRKETHTW